MLKSMTGFGRGEYRDAMYHITAEIRAVNHRYNEVVVRLPKNLLSLEEQVRKTIAAAVSRGRIDAVITVEEFLEKKRTIRVDKELAIAYYSAMKELRDLLEIPESINLSFVAKFPDIIRVEESAADGEVLWPKIAEAVEAAIAALVAMRENEGAAIQADLIKRVERIAGIADEIARRAPIILQEYREKLTARIRESLGSVEIDENRLLQEIVLFADRTCITEELVRLKSHLAQFRETFTQGDAVGRKLDFIVQELNREINTIGSKASDYIIASQVVAVKSELEKIREQIQNIE